MKTPGVLVVNRPALLRQALAHGGLEKRVPSCNCTHEDVFSRYRGFDGQAWPALEHAEFQTEEGLASLADLSAVENYLGRIDRSDECDLIVLASPDLNPDDVPVGIHFLGIDLGFFESEWSHFSSILHEVVYGLEAELRAFSERLNEALLFDTIHDACDLQATRERLVRSGADIETCAAVEPVAIYGRQRDHRMARHALVPCHD
jgi:hypothetical protein